MTLKCTRAKAILERLDGLEIFLGSEIAALFTYCISKYTYSIEFLSILLYCLERFFKNSHVAHTVVHSENSFHGFVWHHHRLGISLGLFDHTVMPHYSLWQLKKIVKSIDETIIGLCCNEKIIIGLSNNDKTIMRQSLI